MKSFDQFLTEENVQGLSDEDKSFMFELTDHFEKLQDNLADLVADIEEHPQVFKLMKSKLLKIDSLLDQLKEQCE